MSDPLVQEMYLQIQRFREHFFGRHPSRIRVQPGVIDHLKALIPPDATRPGEWVVPFDAFYGIPLVVDDDLEVQWRLEWDGPGAS